MWTKFRDSRIVTVAILSFWFLVVAQYFIPLVVLLPITFLPGGTTLYRQITGIYDRYARFACLCVPFSWCGVRVYIDDFELLQQLKDNGDALLLSTHCSRIDWLLAVLCGLSGRKNSRVNFVAEITTGLMPIVGWSRFLFGDILLQRTFHRDRPRIMKNINGFHKDKVERLLFLAPEGAIADPGSEADENYIKQCGDFMRSLGQEPLTHLLTPRYKGMSAFVKHSPKNIAASAMSFVTGRDVTFSDDGTILGGKLCSLSLDNPNRMIPDLHNVFSGGLQAFVSIHHLDVPDCDESDPHSALKIRDVLIKDQQRKDADMRFLEEHRRYPSIKKSSDWTMLPVPHVLMNLILVAHTALSILVCSWLFGVNPIKFVETFSWVFVRVTLIYGVTHAVGELLLGGRSSESLIGETAIKAALVYLTGRSANQGGKPAAATAPAKAKKTKKVE